MCGYENLTKGSVAPFVENRFPSALSRRNAIIAAKN
jgi:hypothetical protein